MNAVVSKNFYHNLLMLKNAAKIVFETGKKRESNRIIFFSGRKQTEKTGKTGRLKRVCAQ
jgi:hypothetical protein